MKFHRPPDWWWLVESEREHRSYGGSAAAVITDAMHAALFRYDLPLSMWPAFDERVRASGGSEHEYLARLFFRIGGELPDAGELAPPPVTAVAQTRLSFSKELWDALSSWRESHNGALLPEAVSSLVEPVLTVFGQPNVVLARLRRQMRLERRTTVDFIAQTVAAHLVDRQ